jgi:hypothetical protein
MANLTLHFQAKEGTDLEVSAKDLEQQLVTLPAVSLAEARADNYRSPGLTEIIAGITLAVGVIQSTTVATQALTKLIDAVNALLHSGRGLQAAFIEVGMRKVPIDKLTPQDIESLAHRIAEA